MYVKIIKCNSIVDWYIDFIGCIFPVNYKNINEYDYNKKIIRKQDCEIVDFNPDQISEEMAREMLLSTNTLEKDEINEYIDIWKNSGYIKQNREDEIKKDVKEWLNDMSGERGEIERDYIDTEMAKETKEFIKIYENKINKEIEKRKVAMDFIEDLFILLLKNNSFDKKEKQK